MHRIRSFLLVASLQAALVVCPTAFAQSNHTRVASPDDAQFAASTSCDVCQQPASADQMQPSPAQSKGFVISLQWTDQMATWRPVIRFLSRGVTPGNSARSGYALVLLGRKAPDDTIAFFGVVGIYPKPSDGSITELNKIIDASGQANYEVDDFPPTSIYTANLSDQQIAIIKDIIYHSPASNNSVIPDFYFNPVAQQVANALGLRYSTESLALPSFALLAELSSANKESAPLDFEKRDLTRRVTLVNSLQQEIAVTFPHGPIHYPPPGPPGAAGNTPGGNSNDNSPGGGVIIEQGPDGNWRVCLPNHQICT